MCSAARFVSSLCSYRDNIMLTVSPQSLQAKSLHLKVHKLFALLHWELPRKQDGTGCPHHSALAQPEYVLIKIDP